MKARGVDVKLKTLVALSVLALSGCSCEERTSRRFPRLELLDEQGNARTLVDFGQVQLSFTSTKTVRVRNAGSAALSITAAAFSDPKFAVGTQLPVTVGVNGEYELPLAFTPTVADQRETATVTLSSDDPERPTVQLSLAGTGVRATAVVRPAAIDFGEVYVGESKAVAVTLTNSGTNQLPVADAGLAGTPSSVTADLSPWRRTLGGGESAMATVRFAPTATGAFSGTLDVALPAGVGDLAVPVRGTGIEAQPRLCFRFEGSAFERCADGTQTLDVRFGALCDGRVYPADGGLECVLDGGAVARERSGRLYVRNDGNTPVSYTVQYQAGQPARCDGGASIDFAFGNAPTLADGGSPAAWTTPTARLPQQVTDARPWETAPVPVTYRARSACRGGDDSDVATVVWARQGEPAGTMRRPGSLVATLTGASMLASPEPDGVTFTGNQPTPQDVTLVSNTGDGPVRLLSAALWQASDGGLKPDQPCAAATVGPCQYFSWVSGPTLPVLLEGTNLPGGRVQRVVGRLAYGTLGDAGTYVVPSQEQRVFAVIETSDPYVPRVTAPIIGRP